MNNYNEEYFNIVRVLDSTYGKLGDNHGVRSLVASYISGVGFNANNIKCELDGEYPKISLIDGSEILYQGKNSGAQISISKQNDTQKMWTVIDFPPNPSAKPYTDPTLPYTPRIDSFYIDETGIFHTSYSPYKTENGKIKYDSFAPLETSFYSNETLSSNGVSKDFRNINANLNKIEPDDKFDTTIEYSLIYDPIGDNTIDFNVVQAAIKIEGTYKDKSFGYKI